MQLLELFASTKRLTEDAKEYSPIGAPSEDDSQDIDWLGDLKFYIDNDDKLLNNHFFPVTKKHRKYVGNANIYKIYIKPILTSIDQYCDHFDIEDRDEKFPDSLIRELARHIAAEQEEHIHNGEYLNSVNTGIKESVELPGKTISGSIREFKHGDTKIAYSIRDDHVDISSVRTPQTKRGAGSAREAMTEFLKATDNAGLPTKLASSPLDNKTSGSKLLAFYKTLGYKESGNKINAVGDLELVRPVGSTTEDAAGVGIVTKQNSTKDVGPGTIRKNLKAFKLV